MALKGVLRRLAAAYAIILTIVNLYFSNYARLHALLHPRSDIRFNLYGDPQIEGDAKLNREPTTGKYDLLFNDYYLRHVYKSTIKAFNPQYVMTMGDIFSCQWVSREEYYRRLHRFKWISYQEDELNNTIPSSHIHYTMAGNHDIGYGEETEPYHIARYTNNFGPLNLDFHVSAGEGKPLHHVAILNAMNLDKSRNKEYQAEVWEFVNKLADDRRENPEIPLLLFLHIPLSKPDGVCIDVAKTKYFDGFVSYQDFLSPTTSAYLLHCLKPTFVFNGHDHRGCVAAHRVVDSSSLKIELIGDDSVKNVTSIDEFCRLTPDELDKHQDILDKAMAETMTAAMEFDGTGGPWSAIEVTVRASMGELDGVTGIFDLTSDETEPDAKGVAAQSDRRNVIARANGFRYQYREVALGNHLIIRILLITDVISVMVLSALFVILRN